MLLNLGWLVARFLIGLGLISLLVYSQYFWYRGLWRVSANWRSTALRVFARLICLVLAGICAVALADGFRMGRNHWIPSGQIFPLFVGMWFTCAFFGFLCVKLVRGIDLAWRSIARAVRERRKAKEAEQSRTQACVELLADPSRRHFFKAATAVAGATPFLGAVYGFAA